MGKDVDDHNMAVLNILLKTGFKFYFDQIEIKSLFHSKSFREYPSSQSYL